MPYNSIESSKVNKAFLSEYQPQAPFIDIGGKNYRIKEAWVEHPHYERNFGDSLGKGYLFVMNFYVDTSDRTDIHQYIKELGNGNYYIWFTLTEVKDTVTVHYRKPSNLEQQKGFLTFKKH